jgi:mannose-6-phosphate isomerase
MGTHPNCPATVVATGQTLQSWIEAHRQCMGPAVQRRFGDNLPFLFKVCVVCAG